MNSSREDDCGTCILIQDEVNGEWKVGSPCPLEAACDCPGDSSAGLQGRAAPIVPSAGRP